MSIKIIQRVLLCTIVFVASAAEQFLTQQTKNTLFKDEISVKLLVDSKEVGSLVLSHLPFDRWIIHDLFVPAQLRKHGYGTKLLNYACDFVRCRGAVKVYIQPGPYEMVQGNGQNVQPGSEREQKLDQLVRLYKKAGFAPVSRAMVATAAAVYKMIGLPEDSGFLMVSALNKN